MSWKEWNSGLRNWSYGRLVPDEILYDFDGPAIFTTRIGLETILFYKADIHDEGDYYLASSVSDTDLIALREGRLSVRGALSQPRCWMMDVDFDLEVIRYEQKNLKDIIPLLPRSGVPIYASFPKAPDSIQQANSPLAFKFFGDDLHYGTIPFDTFKTVIDQVYGVVRRCLTPPVLFSGRDSDVLDIPLQQPQFASLLVAIDSPAINTDILKRRKQTKNLDPEMILIESIKEGARFIEQVERTVDFAHSGRLTNMYAQDYFHIFHSLSEIIPVESGDISRLQISSGLGNQHRFFELDRTVGEKIQYYHKAVRDTPTEISGRIVGTIRKSKTFILRTKAGRDVTCHLLPNIYEELLEAGELMIGRALSVSGTYQRREFRDLMKVTGWPSLL